MDTLIASQSNKKLKIELETTVKSIWAEAVEEGIIQGITQGELKKTLAVVRKCWLRGDSVESISEIAEISISDVRKYIEQFIKEGV